MLVVGFGYFLYRKAKSAGSGYNQVTSAGSEAGRAASEDSDTEDDDQLIADIGSATEDGTAVVPNLAFDASGDEPAYATLSPADNEFAAADGAHEESGYMDIHPPEDNPYDAASFEAEA